MSSASQPLLQPWWWCQYSPSDKTTCISSEELYLALDTLLAPAIDSESQHQPHFESLVKDLKLTPFYSQFVSKPTRLLLKVSADIIEQCLQRKLELVNPLALRLPNDLSNDQMDALPYALRIAVWQRKGCDKYEQLLSGAMRLLIQYEDIAIQAYLARVSGTTNTKDHHQRLVKARHRLASMKNYHHRVENRGNKIEKTKNKKKSAKIDLKRVHPLVNELHQAIIYENGRSFLLEVNDGILEEDQIIRLRVILFCNLMGIKQ